MAKLGKQAWVHAAFDALVTGGVDAVRVEPLARSLGVTKGSFYWHFDTRADLLAAVLAWYEDVGTERVIAEVESTTDDPAGRFRALAERSLGSSRLADAGEPAIRAWASIDALAARTLARVDTRRIDYVAGLLVSSGLDEPVARRRAQVFYRLLVGEFVWRAHGGEAMDAEARDEVVQLVLRGTG